MRAVGDLADPVLAQHRLAAGPGDAGLAANLATLADGRDPRVVREVLIAVARLRWGGAPTWLDRTLRHPDPALAHAAIQALRRSANGRGRARARRQAGQRAVAIPGGSGRSPTVPIPNWQMD